MQYVASVANKAGKAVFISMPRNTREEAAAEAFAARPRAVKCSTCEARQDGSQAHTGIVWHEAPAKAKAAPKRPRKASVARFPNHDDIREVAEIATALGWEAATIRAEGRGWFVHFIDANGEARRSHTKAVPAAHLRQWIGGAMTMKELVERERAKLAEKNAEAVVWTVADATDKQLVDEVNKRAKQKDIDLGEAFGEAMEFDSSQIRSHIEWFNTRASTSERDTLYVFTDEELQQEIDGRLGDSPVFVHAARLAFESDNVEAGRAELRHLFMREHNLYGASSAQLGIFA